MSDDQEMIEWEVIERYQKYLTELIVNNNKS